MLTPRNPTKPTARAMRELRQRLADEKRRAPTEPDRFPQPMDGAKP